MLYRADAYVVQCFVCAARYRTIKIQKRSNDEVKLKIVKRRENMEKKKENEEKEDKVKIMILLAETSYPFSFQSLSFARSLFAVSSSPHILYPINLFLAF